MDLVAEIRAAFPVTPYPGDRILSDCWCDECAWAVRNLRGKSWKHVRPEDFNAGDGGHLGKSAFRYYLPALMVFAVQHPDELHFAGEINGRFVVVTGESAERVEAIREMVSRLSKPQRSAIVHFFQWLQGQGWQAPILIDAAIKAVADSNVEPIPADSILKFVRAKEAENRKRGRLADSS